MAYRYELPTGYPARPAWRWMPHPVRTLQASWSGDHPTTPNRPGDDRSNWVDMRTDKHGRIIVPVSINGIEAEALLDTGASRSLIGEAFATEAGLPVLASTQTAIAIGGTTCLKTARIQRWAFLDRTWGQTDVPVVDLHEHHRVSGANFDVVIGCDWLRNFALEIDFDRKILVAHRAFHLQSGQEAVPISARSDLLFTRIAIGGGPYGAAMIDTGASNALAVPSSAARYLPARRVSGWTTIAVSGIAGIAVEKLLADVAYHWLDTGTETADLRIEAESGFLHQLGFSAQIGMGLLARHNLVFDLPKRRLILGRRKTRPDQPGKPTVGVQGEYRDDGLVILHIMANSPAASVGLQAGDRIVSVNGETIRQDWPMRGKNQWGLAPAGTHHSLLLADGQMIAVTSDDFC